MESHVAVNSFILSLPFSFGIGEINVLLNRSTVQFQETGGFVVVLGFL